MPSNSFVAQPVHLWTLNGSKWQELDATAVNGV
jgi:hypothetical protein